MVDFSKLGAMTAEEHAEVDRRSRMAHYAREDAERDASSRKAVVITLDREPETRFKPDGTEMAIFRGREDGRTSSLVAVYEKPLRAVNEDDAASEYDRRMRDLGGGDRMTLAGNWAKRVWKDQEGARRESWEFKSQHFAKGEVPLDAMLSTARDAGRESPAAARDFERASPSPVRGADRAATGLAAAAQASRGSGI